MFKDCKILLMIKYFITLILGLALALTACTWQNEEELYPPDDCSTDNVTYGADIQPFLQMSCYSCHSTINAPVQSGLDLEDQTSLKNVAESGRLIGALSHQDGFVPMPPNGVRLDSCDLKKIQQWISDGTNFN